LSYYLELTDRDSCVTDAVNRNWFLFTSRMSETFTLETVRTFRIFNFHISYYCSY